MKNILNRDRDSFFIGEKGQQGVPGRDAEVILNPVGNTPNQNGGTYLSPNLTLQPADENNPGLINTSTQIFNGYKMFNDLNVPMMSDPSDEPIVLNGITFKHPTNPICDVILTASAYTEGGGTHAIIPGASGGEVVLTEGWELQDIRSAKLFRNLEVPNDQDPDIMGYRGGILFTGATNNLNLVTDNVSTDIKVKIPDPGSDCDFVLTKSNQTVGGVKTFSNGLSFGSSILNFYETWSSTSTVSGPWSSPQTCLCKCVRIGDSVVLKLVNPSNISIETTASIVGQVITFNTTLPANFRPSQNLYFSCGVRDSGAPLTGRLNITTAGVVTVSKINGDTFGGTSNCGFINLSIAYVI